MPWILSSRPIGSRLGKKWSATSWPITTTGAPSEYSCGLIRRPFDTPIFLIANHPSETVEHCVRRGFE